MTATLLVLATALLAQRKPPAEVKVVDVKTPASIRAGSSGAVHLELEIPQGWYIYPTKPTTTGTPTKLVLEGLDTGAYVEPKPKLHPKEEFLDAYEYHEGKIAISAVVSVPRSTPPGPLAVKGVLDYQICKPGLCVPVKTPVAFTLDVQARRKPPAEIEVVAARPPPGPVKTGETFKVAFELRIPDGWYVYPAAPTTSGTPLKLVSEASEVAGPYEEPKPKTKPKDEVQEAYDYHEGTIVLTVPLKLKAGTPAGPFEWTGELDYQICNPTTCIPAKTPVSFTLTVQEGGEAAAPAGPASRVPPSFLLMLGFAFLGGLILNVMPCVLPVLLSKLGSLVKQKELSAGSKRAAALAYTAGVLLCLLGFGTAVVILRSLGRSVGWGFQFQEPLFVISLATLIFVFALSLLGVFTVPALATGAAAQVAGKKGLGKHFFSGLFVTLVATPCSAPFLGSAMGYAFVLPAWGILLFFGAVALGLASPFLIVGFVPALLRFMPRPGAWMEVFERITGFILLAVVVWLCDTIGALTGREGLIGFLAFLTAVGLGAWIIGHWGNEVRPRAARLGSLAAALILAAGAGAWFVRTEIVRPAEPLGFRTENLDFSEKIPWQPFSEENVAAVRASRKPGFIDFTADW